MVWGPDSAHAVFGDDALGLKGRIALAVAGPIGYCNRGYIVNVPLEQEREFFKQHQADLLKRHPGKFVLVKGSALVDVFDTDEAAVREGIRLYGTESFLVRGVFENEEAVRIPALMFGLINAHSPHSV